MILVYCKKLETILKDLYSKYKLIEYYEKDFNYLKEAYLEIERLWFAQYLKICKINFVIISEAPLWGEEKKYFYNELVKPSQFIYSSDLSNTYHRTINDKKQLIQAFNDLGIIILDVSPFPFNPNITAINYRKNYPTSKKLRKKDYHNVIRDTSDYHLLRKLNMVLDKSEKLVFLFRYARVKKFYALIKELFENNKFILDGNSFDIWQKGGGFNKEKIKLLLINKTV